MLKPNTTIERLLATPAGATMLAQAEDAEQTERLARRQTLAAELAELRAGEAATTAEHDGRLTEARKAHETAAQAVRDAEDVLRRVHAERARDTYTCSHRAEALERELRVSASPLIADFVAACEEAKRDLRASLVTWREGGAYSVPTDSFRGGSERSNGPEIGAALKAVTAVQAEALPLMLQPLSDSDIEKRIGKLRARLEKAAALSPTPETARA